jgi:predicted Rossmann fold flavoprotein
MLSNLGHTIVDPVPSLFTFRIADNRLKDLAGVSVSHGEARIEGTKHAHEGPLLVTHHGLSGPGILKLSAWAARELAEVNYNFTIRVNWDARFDKESAIDYLIDFKQEHARKQVKTYSPFKMPHRLWVSLLQSLGTVAEATWASISLKQLDLIAEAAVRSYFDVSGKNTFKDEFVTAGGIELKEVDFKTMQSKRLPGVFFAGEVLNIDAVTGGFNFQAAWTTSWIAAAGMANREE